MTAGPCLPVSGNRSAEPFEFTETELLRMEVAGLRAEQARMQRLILAIVDCGARPAAVAEIRDHQLSARERAAIAWQRPAGS